MVDDYLKSEVDRILGEEKEKIERHVIKKVGGFVKKKSPWKRFKDNFIEEDFPTVTKGLYNEFVRPTIKGFMADLVVGWAERTFGVGSYARKAVRRSVADSLVRDSLDYSSLSRDRVRRLSDSQARRDEAKKFNLDDIVMRDRASAQDLLDTLRETIREYGQVSVGELYDILDRTDSDFTDNYYGWTDLNEVPIRRTATGYRLVLPEVKPLR